MKKDDQMPPGSPDPEVVRAIMDGINRLPQTRTEVVLALKKALRTGAYHVDAVKIAEKMIAEMTS